MTTAAIICVAIWLVLFIASWLLYRAAARLHAETKAVLDRDERLDKRQQYLEEFERRLLRVEERISNGARITSHRFSVKGNGDAT